MAFLKKEDGSWNLWLVAPLLVGLLVLAVFVYLFMARRQAGKPSSPPGHPEVPFRRYASNKDIMNDVRIIHQAGGKMPKVLEPFRRFDATNVTKWQGHRAHTGQIGHRRGVIEDRYGITLPPPHTRPKNPPVYNEFFGTSYQPPVSQTALV